MTTKRRDLTKAKKHGNTFRSIDRAAADCSKFEKLDHKV